MSTEQDQSMNERRARVEHAKSIAINHAGKAIPNTGEMSCGCQTHYISGWTNFGSVILSCPDEDTIGNTDIFHPTVAQSDYRHGDTKTPWQVEPHILDEQVVPQLWRSGSTYRTILSSWDAQKIISERCGEGVHLYGEHRDRLEIGLPRTMAGALYDTDAATLSAVEAAIARFHQELKDILK